MQSHIKAFFVIGILIIGIRIALAFEAGWIMLLPLFASMIFVTRLSPPVASLTLLYGWVLFGLMDFRGFWLIPRIPTISTLTVWTLFWLFHWRRVDGSLKHLDRPVVINHFILLILFFLIGILGSLNSGYLSNPLVRFYNWDVLRGWLGFLVIAMLGCRNLGDLRVMLIGIPFAFLLYPLSLPLETWKNLFVEGLFSSAVLSIGLSYGSLNTNTLGQGAAFAAVASAAVAFTLQRSPLRSIMFILLIVAAAIVLMTSARQALLGFLAGLFVIAILLGNRRRIWRLFIFASSIYIGAQIVLSLLPQGSGFQSRLLELTQPPENWASQSFTIRQSEFEEALARWMEAPLFGTGFGGQRFNKTEFVESFSDEDAPWINYTLSGTHNLFLAILVQTGLVGMFLFIVLNLSIFFRFLRILRYCSETSYSNAHLLRVSVLASLACFFVAQNISGGLGVSSSTLVFLLGAILGVLGAARTYPTASTGINRSREEKIQIGHGG